MVSSIANSLGFGSGLDVKQLVTDLSNASREPKIARVTELTQTNQTRISALAQARADLDGFADSQIGRASCRERVCQYVYISVGAVSLKKKTKRTMQEEST